MRKLIVAALALGAASPASAQGFFKLDAVFVSRFLAEPDTLDVEAQQLHALLESYLGESFLVTPLSTVPAFDDYSAAVYLQNCPTAQYNECSYVIASRAKADWAVTARYTSENPYDLSGDRDVDISIIDVESSRAVISFGATVARSKEEVFAKGVAGVLGKIINGDRDISDIRTDVVDEKAEWERKREIAAEAAQELAGYEDIDLIVRGMSFDDELDQPKLTVSDLSEYDDRDDESPWERFEMSREEYVRYKNSGDTLKDWRVRALGRQRRLLLKAMVGAGGGPYHHYFDGRIALDADTLQPVELHVFQEIQGGGTVAGSFEASFGLTPNIDIGLGTTLRTGTYTTMFHQEKVGDDEPERPAVQVPWFTPSYNAFATYALMPTSQLRPFVTVGGTLWLGSSVHQVVGDQMPSEITVFAPFETPGQMFFDTSAGIEARMSDQVDFTLRGGTQLRIAGTPFTEWHQGPEVLYTRGIPQGSPGLGFVVQAGLTLKLAPFGVPEVEGERDPLWDDEPIEDFD